MKFEASTHFMLPCTTFLSLQPPGTLHRTHMHEQRNVVCTVLGRNMQLPYSTAPAYNAIVICTNPSVLNWPRQQKEINSGCLQLGTDTCF